MNTRLRCVMPEPRPERGFRSPGPSRRTPAASSRAIPAATGWTDSVSSEIARWSCTDRPPQDATQMLLMGNKAGTTAGHRSSDRRSGDGAWNRSQRCSGGLL